MKSAVIILIENLKCSFIHKSKFCILNVTDIFRSDQSYIKCMSFTNWLAYVIYIMCIATKKYKYFCLQLTKFEIWSH